MVLQIPNKVSLLLLLNLPDLLPLLFNPLKSQYTPLTVKSITHSVVIQSVFCNFIVWHRNLDFRCNHNADFAVETNNCIVYFIHMQRADLKCCIQYSEQCNPLKNIPGIAQSQTRNKVNEKINFHLDSNSSMSAFSSLPVVVCCIWNAIHSLLGPWSCLWPERTT